MDDTTAGIRYRRWVQIIQDCNDSGLTKREYCQRHGIKEKTFYYYQRRIRTIIAAQAEPLTLPEASFEAAAYTVGQQGTRPQVVKLRFPGMTQADGSMINFSVNAETYTNRTDCIHYDDVKCVFSGNPPSAETSRRRSGFSASGSVLPSAFCRVPWTGRSAPDSGSPPAADGRREWLPEDHPDAALDRFPVEKLADYPFIITQPGRDTDIDRVFAEAHIHADIRFDSMDAYATWRMVEAGLGISLNQRLIAREWTGRVAVIPFDPPQYVHLGIAVPSMKEASPAAKRFMEYVL